MYHDESKIHIQTQEYDSIVSIGNKCSTVMMLRQLQIYKKSFPFDIIPTSPSQVLKYLKKQDDFYPAKNEIRNKDGVWFGHFNVTDQYEETITTLKRRFDRLLEALTDKTQKVLLVYSSQAHIWNEQSVDAMDEYDQLLEIMNYIRTDLQNDQCTLLAIHTNRSYPNEKDVINCTIHVPVERYDNFPVETYREVLKSALTYIFHQHQILGGPVVITEELNPVITNTVPTQGADARAGSIV